MMKFYGIKDFNTKKGSEIVAVIQTKSHVDARWYYINKLKEDVCIIDISSHELDGMKATNLLNSGVTFYTFEGITEYLETV
ncbi:Uncharacterized protein BCRIVMBC845_06440 [Bacillus cereus]|nr:Uncharacterized protein BCRIVMBC845_06440 [Bacillus cereus]